ncbi:hypothetical protein Pfo_024512 [Paulownia fortunei]|nr:hypothetical protein Pfo_024512 [Paulownia fortunei]
MEQLEKQNMYLTRPWMILGDFNNVIKFEEKCNGIKVTAYKIKDMVDCCLTIGLSDLQKIGCLFTWSNNKVWNKLNRALVNNLWMLAGFIVQTNFLLLRCLSDHSPCIVSLFQHKRV